MTPEELEKIKQFCEAEKVWVNITGKWYEAEPLAYITNSESTYRFKVKTKDCDYVVFEKFRLEPPYPLKWQLCYVWDEDPLDKNMSYFLEKTSSRGFPFKVMDGRYSNCEPLFNDDGSPLILPERYRK